ncbi:hypothetical protein MASR1M12_24580 [Erysipelotrichia bacterium]
MRIRITLAVFAVFCYPVVRFTFVDNLENLRRVKIWPAHVVKDAVIISLDTYDKIG